MKKHFVPYELAVKLKELGFDEECLMYYEEGSKRLVHVVKGFHYDLLAPLWQQAARFLSDISSNRINITINGKDNYEELCKKFKKAIENFRNL